MDSFNLVAGMSSILSLLLAIYDIVRRKRKAKERQAPPDSEE